MRLVTERDIPYEEAFLSDEFIMFNMGREIWLVDKQFPLYDKIKETALSVAKTFGNKEDIEKLQAA